MKGSETMNQNTQETIINNSSQWNMTFATALQELTEQYNQKPRFTVNDLTRSQGSYEIFIDDPENKVTDQTLDSLLRFFSVARRCNQQIVFNGKLNFHNLTEYLKMRVCDVSISMLQDFWNWLGTSPAGQGFGLDTQKDVPKEPTPS